jgi:hypothetical protein
MILRFFGALVVAAAPFAGYPLGLFGSLVTFLVAFAICGLGAGWVFGFIAMAAGAVTCAVAIGVAYLLSGLDPDSAGADWALIAYIFGPWGSALFCVAALIGASLRLLVLQRASASGSAEG